MKKYIIGFIVGLIVAITIGVSATILYQATDIGFTPEDNNWNVNNLKSALDNLYGNNFNFVVDDNYFVSAYGEESSVKTISQVLPTGDYIISAYNNKGIKMNGSSYTSESNLVNVTCDKNCIISKIDERQTVAAGSGYCESYTAIYKVKVVEEDTTITQESVWSDSTNASPRVTMSMQIVKLS